MVRATPATTSDASGCGTMIAASVVPAAGPSRASTVRAVAGVEGGAGVPEALLRDPAAPALSGAASASPSPCCSTRECGTAGGAIAARGAACTAAAAADRRRASSEAARASYTSRARPARAPVMRARAHQRDASPPLHQWGMGRERGSRARRPTRESVIREHAARAAATVPRVRVSAVAIAVVRRWPRREHAAQQAPARAGVGRR